MSVPIEATKAALRATNEGGYRYLTHISLTVALEAAAPHLMAQALEDAVSAVSGPVVPVGLLLSRAAHLRSNS